MKSSNLKYLLFLIIGLTIFVYKLTNIPHSDGKLKMYFLDVGQGDATLLQTPEEKLILVDGGPDGKVLMSQLARFFPFGSCKLEAVVLTHPDSDHENGLLEALKRCEVKTVIANTEKCTLENCKQLNELASSVVGADRRVRPQPTPAINGTTHRSSPTTNIVISGFSGDVFQIGNVTLSVLNPPPYQNFSDANTNDDSIVLDVSFNGFHALLTGDAEKTTLERVMETRRGDLPTGQAGIYDALKTKGLINQAPTSAVNEKIDVLKVPHHGSFNNFDAAFWETTKPEVAIVSVGQNSYGHPSPKVLSAATAMGVKTLRTDEKGTIEIDVDAKGNWEIP